MRVLVASLLLAAIPLPGQNTVPKEVLALARIERRMKERLQRIPDFTCLETIERSVKDSPSGQEKRFDTVRIEVAHVAGKEMYAWPGVRGFAHEKPAAFLDQGVSSTGEFAAHAHSVFLSGTTRIVYSGEEETGGRKLLRYDFRVPLYGSQWIVRIAGNSGEAASRGSFWADPDTYEVVRLRVQADEIPPNVPIDELSSTIDYAPVQIGAGPVWLPQSSSMLLREMSGRESRNRIEFSHCRQYVGESTILFTEPEPQTEMPPAPRVAEVPLPLNLRLSVELDAAISLEQAHVGDPITATVVADALEKKKVAIPKNAVLRGRIRRLDQASQPEPHYVVGLEFFALEFDGKHAQFFGSLQEIGGGPGVTRSFWGSKEEDLPSRGGSVRRTSLIWDYRPTELPGVGTFFVRQEHRTLPRGLKMVWYTEKVR